MSADQFTELYESYLAACNDRDWDRLATFVHSSVLVNGVVRSRQEYVDDILKTTQVFPDYFWELQRMLHQPPWFAVHLHTRGTRHQPFLGAPGDQSAVETDEFVMYRVADGHIHEVWGTADNARLRL
ncbi:ester cyclase [Kineosporia rhizophila]|uniref:ester cyclase n=1 Tax=Kineosporia TaxID=49184 RepID=UPI001E389C1D|nr:MULTISPECIES: ester cyclase [Kineosporia]MCE0540389.1 ester cyclase [Kineosporia rhizophila]GLY16643.1 hypothetical protein Kisp01_36580 [Kineosporia sp. NBRC 101677]